MVSAVTRFLDSVGERTGAVGLGFILWFLKRLGPVRASNLGGWIARSLGPSLPVSRIAHANLRLALPELDAAERTDIVRAVWDNLGRTTAELPHLPTFTHTGAGPGWEVTGADEVVERLNRTGAQALFFSGHFGNWEMILPIAGQLGIPLAGIYRAASNQRIDAIIQAIRQQAMGPGAAMFAKGARGARAALLHLQRGGSLGLLVDQKMNDGIAVPFLGVPAMTAPALAQFALRYRCMIIPAHVVRLGPARFRMMVEPPLAITLTGDRRADLYAITLAVNAVLERWVRADPKSWLWLHRRWPRRVLEEAPLGETSHAS
jgi:KDO2-lipid IV(A) lauroyltransferase